MVVYEQLRDFGKAAAFLKAYQRVALNDDWAAEKRTFLRSGVSLSRDVPMESWPLPNSEPDNSRPRQSSPAARSAYRRGISARFSKGPTWNTSSSGSQPAQIGQHHQRQHHVNMPLNDLHDAN